MGVVHGGGWFIRSSHVALIYSPKPRIYFIHYAFVGAEPPVQGMAPESPRSNTEVRYLRWSNQYRVNFAGPERRFIIHWPWMVQCNVPNKLLVHLVGLSSLPVRSMAYLLPSNPLGPSNRCRL